MMGSFGENVFLRTLTKSLKNKCERVHYIYYMTDHVFEMYLRRLEEGLIYSFLEKNCVIFFEPYNSYEFQILSLKYFLNDSK